MTTDNGVTLTSARRRELCVMECTACEREYFYATDLDELDETLGQNTPTKQNITRSVLALEDAPKEASKSSI